MANELKQYFPLLRERKEVLQEIQDHEELLSIFESRTEFILLPLDIYLKNLHNRGISNELDAWLAFFSTDEMQDTIDEQKGMLEGQRKLPDEQKELIEGQQMVLEN